MAWLVASAAAALALFVSPVSAQNAVPDEVRIDVGEFGVGNIARAGDWCGLRLKLTDSASKQREVLVGVAVEDADQDKAVYSRLLTLNPGVAQDAWFYFRLPFWFTPGEGLLVQVNEPISDDSVAAGARPGRLLARKLITSTGRIVEPSRGLFAVIGTNEMGLRQYATQAGAGQPWPALGHEVTDSASGIAVRSLPDRWLAWAPFEAVFWGDSPGGSEADVSQLRGERTRALKEWVQRGGHLIIVLPPTGQPWTNAATNEILDILPAVNITRREGVDLAAYRQLIVRSPDAPLPRSAVVHTFEPKPDAAPGEAMRILNGPNGDCLVARRLVGTGAVTLVGLDFSSRLLSQGGSLDADVFWHRVLGRRGILSPETKEVVPRSQSEAYVDRVIASQVAKRGTAATGLLLGVLLFVFYWLIAGPVGFAALKHRNAQRLAWVAFVAIALVFTAIAFGAATWFRPAKFEATHLTILDHTYGQRVQRARSWMALMLPRDGTVTLVGPDSEGAMQAAGSRRELGGVLAPWDPVGASQRSGFLDARDYRIDARDPARLDLPSRSTVKLTQLDWAGAPRWKMPRPFHEEGIRAEGSRLLGSLVHELPGPLTDVTIVHVQGQRPLGADLRPRLVSNVQFWKLPGSWAPNTPRNLADDTAVAASGNAGELYLANLVPLSQSGFGMQASDPRFFRDLQGAMNAASFYTQFGIPDDVKGNTGMSAGVVRREATHAMDLGRWFTQPCIIVIGYLTDANVDAPISTYVDGRAVPSRGTTVVRWVYPLPESPPVERVGQEAAPK